ncbi:MAG: DUF294 nucleotidyltransferase-like domain-containing protein [Bacillota bacterium]|nr:DUF294 nucleotidyltransferase-like domain-containing protein [Bacillota bacterium]
MLTLLKETPPFSELTEAVLKECAGDFRVRLYPRGSYIFRQGEPSREVFFVVVSGLVEILLATDTGEEKAVSLRRPPDFFGETVFFSNEAYPASTRAVEDTRCLLVPRGCFEKLMATDPRFAGYFSRMLAERMRHLWDGVIREQFVLGQGAERPFRKRLYEIMSTPVVTCRESDTVTDIARLISEKQISSVIVIDQSGGPLGIVTEKDLVKKILAAEHPGRNRLTAGEIMGPDPVILPPAALFQEALLAMVQRQCKHVIVADHRLVRGIVTLADLVRTQNVDALSALTAIERARDPDALKAAMRQIDRVVLGLVAGQATAAETGVLVSELYDQLVKRLIFIAEEELYAEGKGYAPCGYCWLTMGSGGRREQVIRTDQDNALVYEDPPPGKEAAFQEYFLALGGKVVAGLVELGFAPCPGKVMANNAEWCKSYREWLGTVRSWVREPQGDQLRKMTIFFDFRPVCGLFALAEKLRETILHQLGGEQVVLHFLARDALAKKIPLNPLRQVVTEKSGPHKDELDIKRSVLIHFVDCIRLFALREGVTATSTFDRLRELVKLDVFGEDDAETFRLAYDNMLMMRLRDSLQRLSQGWNPSNYVNPRRMSRRELNALREALVVASRLQYLTGMSFRV